MPSAYHYGRIDYWSVALLSGVLIAAVAQAAPTLAQNPNEQPASIRNRRCLNCHGQAHIAGLNPEERLTMVGAPTPPEQDENGEPPPETRPGLFLDAERVYQFSVHRDVTCESCHVDCEELPHPSKTARATCGTCHETEYAEYITSLHGESVKDGNGRAAYCNDCHGSHDILSHLNPQSRTYKLNLPYTCAACHANPELMEEEDVANVHAAEQYLDSMHGRGLLEQGLLVAPTCNDCHGVHAILPSEDPRSSIHKDNIPATCGQCHRGIEVVYEKSVHGQLLAAGDDRGPVCATCHTAHQILNPTETAFKLHSDERCGECHEERLERYRETFHGKAMALGTTGVAACYDCHGHHDIVPFDDPDCRLSDERRLETCQQCHPDAGPNFADYYAHADHSDRENYPILYWTFLVMTTIVLGTFTFFGIHTALWLVRSAVLYLRNPSAFRAAKMAAVKDEEIYVRFRPFERFLHGLVATSFLLLVATGIPIKFYDAEWAIVMVRFMGGTEVTSALHRFGAIITFFYFGLHLTSIARAAFRNRHRFRNPKTGRYNLIHFLRVAFGPDMPLPNFNDFRDFWAHQKWFFGRGPQPQFDKWTYWEKFDYFAVFWGVMIIGFSGLIMWFPEFFTILLPGWSINVAMVIHSDEALLAAGFIFTFHFFNVHFRIEKFPMDPVIFSGRISKTEMLHERKRWYERLQKENKLDSIKVRDEWLQWKRVMHPVGFMLFSIGVALLIMIFYAMGMRLLELGQ